MSKLKRLLCVVLSAALTATLLVGSASACSMIYVGSDLTDTGETYFARSEDLSGSVDKIAYVSPAGNHTKGEVYAGCYGFTWTFTHDSYSYTAVRDDNLLGVCPDCGSTDPKHTPYEEVGTNEKGVTVTATETLYTSDTMEAFDPYPDDGIEEAEIPTILLSEAATAREAVDLLLSIYDASGTQGGNGIIIADDTETWYIENFSGSQYIAIKLTDDMIFVNPNMGVLGLMDLDDTENLIASKDIIAIAKEAGTYVGSEADNTINFLASYSEVGEGTIGSRMINGLNYVNDAYGYTSENIDNDDYTISNVKDGAIVPFYSPITADRTITVSDVVDFFKVDAIGRRNNQEWHVYAIGDTDSVTDTVEWLGMAHGAYSVAVPYYPMLTTDMADCYMVGTETASFVTEEPTDGSDYYPYTKYNWRTGVSTDGYMVLPDGWEDSCYWCFDAVAEYVLYGNGDGACSDEMKQLIVDTYAALQEKIYDEFDEVAPQIEALAATDLTAAQELATASSKAWAEEAHDTALMLYSFATGSFDMTAGEAMPALPEGYTWASDALVIGTQTVSILYNGEASTAATVTVYPADVDADAWYADAVLYSYNNGLTTGTSATVFSPNTEMSRAMFVTMLYRMAGSPTVTEASSFTDVAASAYYADAVAWASSLGITNGVSETEFAPNDPVNREQLVTFLWRYAELVDGAAVHYQGDLSDYADGTSVSGYAKDAMVWATEKGLVVGRDSSTLAPLAIATRAELVTVLMRYAAMA